MAKSIVDKLKLETYRDILIRHQPEGSDAFQVLTYDVEITKPTYDLIFSFVFSLDEIIKELQHIHQTNLLKEKGYIYFAYPKKGNKKYDVYIGRDDLFDPNSFDEVGYFLDSPLKFARMVSMDETFTVVGVKHEAKKDKPSTKASQSVHDYVKYIDEIKSILSHDETLLSFYENLTPGYQRDWARYVFSAKREETRIKRQQEMIEVLMAGYKTIDHYRRDHR